MSVRISHGCGRKCPAIFRPDLESLNDADRETLMKNVTVKESNLETQRVVWTAVAKSIKEGIAAAHSTAPTDLQMLSFVAWATSRRMVTAVTSVTLCVTKRERAGAAASHASCR